MLEIKLKAFIDELEKIAKQDTQDKQLTSGQKTMINLGAGAIAGGASGLAVAPLATVADIAGTNAKSVGDSFYNMKPMQIAKELYTRGASKAIAKGQNKVLGGIKEFYGGQALKTFKMLPQNALNLAIFAGATTAIAKALTDKKNKG